MLKSTYRKVEPIVHTGPPLPPGWTEHQAPSGHLYYYHAASQESTYERPQVSTLPEVAPPPQPENSVNGHERPRPQRRRPHDDRPKSKQKIPNAEPWVLVQTRLGRRFVHNEVTDVSLWKFPTEVLKAVVELDRCEREKRQAGKTEPEHNHAQLERRKGLEEAKDIVSAPPVDQQTTLDDEYEEVEVTDSEGESQPPPAEDKEVAVEFNEDDIAYQLQAMGQDYGLDPGEYGDAEGGELEEGAEGLPLTEQDSTALFNDLLNDLNPNPYSTWETIIDQIIDDDRYTVLSSMRARRQVWNAWSESRMKELKIKREQQAQTDPRLPYFAFLQEHGTPKLYWPEFRRKYQKQPAMRNSKLADKDREKWYREYVNRLKMPESTLKADMLQTLKTMPLSLLNKSSNLQNLPADLLTDVRFVSLRQSIRDPLVEVYIASLPAAPIVRRDEASESRDGERLRREKALAERQAQVQQSKHKQQQALRQSRDMLRQGEQAVEQALQVDRRGLLLHEPEAVAE